MIAVWESDISATFLMLCLKLKHDSVYATENPSKQSKAR